MESLGECVWGQGWIRLPPVSRDRDRVLMTSSSHVSILRAQTQRREGLTVTKTSFIPVYYYTRCLITVAGRTLTLPDHLCARFVMLEPRRVDVAPGPCMTIPSARRSSISGVINPLRTRTRSRCRGTRMRQHSSSPGPRTFSRHLEASATEQDEGGGGSGQNMCMRIP